MSDQMLIKAAASSLRITPVEKDKKPDRHKDGTVRSVNSDGAYLVALDEAPETPITCVPYCTAMVGDRVAVVLRTDGVYMAIGRQGGEIGGGGEVAMTVNDASNYVAGKVFAHAGTNDPAGALLCDGRAVSRREYWELFDAIGTTYGAGDGSSTFNLPNIESRTIIGESDSYALGATGGEEKHTLTEGELPKLSGRAWFRNWTWGGGSQGSTFLSPDGILKSEAGGTTGYDLLNYGSAQGGSTILKAEFGGDQPHNNMQPYIVMRYFITTGKGDPVSGINPADYVVEWKSNDNGWYWEKWASGKAECRCLLENYALDGTYDDLYYTSVTLDFPFEFATIDGFRATGQDENNLIDASISTITTTSVKVYISSAVANIVDACASVAVSGKWKDSPASGGTETIAPTIAEKFESIEADIDYLRSPDSKVLCELAAFMHESQTITLSEPVSEQEHGIVLVFGYFNGSEAQGYDFAYHFVPKKQVDWGVGANFSEFCEDGHFAKYLYIGNDQITGYKANDDVFTKDGVTFTNTRFVLRYVLGV